jgi:hypothetical protein
MTNLFHTPPPLSLSLSGLSYLGSIVGITAWNIISGARTRPSLTHRPISFHYIHINYTVKRTSLKTAWNLACFRAAILTHKDATFSICSYTRHSISTLLWQESSAAQYMSEMQAFWFCYNSNMLETATKLSYMLSLYKQWRRIGLREVEAPTFSDIRLTDGGKVVSPMRRPLFTQKDSRYSFLLRGCVNPRSIVHSWKD